MITMKNKKKHRVTQKMYKLYKFPFSCFFLVVIDAAAESNLNLIKFVLDFIPPIRERDSVYAILT